MSAKIIVGTVAGLTVLAGGAILAARMGSAESVEAPASQIDTQAGRTPLVVVDEVPPSITINEPVSSEQNPGEGGQARPGQTGFQREGGMWGGNMSPEEMRAQMLARFDLDGDGELNEEERQAMREAMRAEREAQRERWLLERYDKNGDGVLSDDERAQADAERDEMRRRMEELEAQRQARLLAEFDADGDGVLSPDEQRTARQAQREWAEAQRAELFARFETDENGRLTADGRTKLRETMRDVMNDFQFVSRFDADGDGLVTANDVQGYLDSFYAQDRRADVNNDGFVDEVDLADFQQRVAAGQSADYLDMMQRMETAPGGMMPGPGMFGAMFGGGMGGPGGGDSFRRRGGGGEGGTPQSGTGDQQRRPGDTSNRSDNP